MTTRTTIVLAWGFLLVSLVPTWAEPPVLRIARVTEPPRLEQYVDAAADPPGTLVTDFVQREPGDGVPASQETRAYLSYDQQHLYVVFVCRDEPGRTRVNLTRREAISSDDVVAIFLDTYHDGRRAYLFLANPLGIQQDGISAEGQDDDYSFDALWRSEGRLTADGYVVLFAVPFKSLRFSNAEAQTWGVALGRAIQRANETSFWPHLTRRISSLGPQLARLEGIEGVSPGRNLQAIPYGSFAAARFLDERAGQVTDRVARAGVDAKAVIKDAVTVDVTVNPDFSQVESDEPQVTVNQRFEVFFPEKRPFFIENADYFETPERLFFSRRIADPRLGGRVTGRSAGWAFAGLLVDDEQPGRAVAVDDPRRDARAGIGVVRVRREFARQSHVGGLFTDREIGPTANRVYGVDGRWRVDDTWSITGQWAASDTRGVDGRSASGRAGSIEVDRRGRSFAYGSSVLVRSPDFRADLGFIPRVDLIETTHETGYSWHPTGRAVLRAEAEVEGQAIWDYAGTLQEWIVEPGAEIELPGQTELGVRYWERFERFEGHDFRRRSTGVYASSEWWRWLGGSIFWGWGTGVNYYPAPGLAPFLASAQEAEARVTVRPTPRLRVDQAYLFSRLFTRAPAGELAGDVFNNHILRSRASYQFTRELSLRAIVDYEAVIPNEALVSLEREKRVGVDLLATYLVNPWTALHVGYTDAYANWRLEPANRPPVARGGAPTTSVGRQVFVKLSYLLRY